MNPGKQNITFRPGADFKWPLVWKDEKGKPVNLTGFSALMQFRESADSPLVIAEFSTANGRIVLGGATGSITIDMDAANTGLVTHRGALVYDLILVAPGGDDYPLLEGKVTIRPVVSKQ
jgi:hypothetical protein